MFTLFGCISFAELRGRDTRALLQIFRLIWIQKSIQKIPYLNQATQKHPGIENLKPQKIMQSSPSFEIQSTPPPTSWDLVK